MLWVYLPTAISPHSPVLALASESDKSGKLVTRIREVTTQEHLGSFLHRKNDVFDADADSSKKAFGKLAEVH